MANAKAARKERSRERILTSAGVLLREKGISGASVAEVMEGAGMTVGGFYAHFPSKRSLVAETLRDTLRRSRSLLMASAEGKRGADWVSAMARSYLSPQHRDNPRVGCPLPSTLGEVAREDEEVRKALAEEMGEAVSEVASRLKEEGVEDPRGEALALFSIMVGGLTLARALKGSTLSDQVLLACRRHIERYLAGSR
ncbi:MAG: TetR/AcrR family transcriptional regulator [Actinobacteria bacterium]|nr:TetR/AcrR family transcriptional regulator [Actinomycetota bacterium]